MSEKSRTIKSKIWTDGFVSRLPPEGKLLFIYLITNALSNWCGIYEITLRQISFDTGLSEKVIIPNLEEFAKCGKVLFTNNWIILKNFQKHHKPNQFNAQIVAKEMEEVPDEIKRASEGLSKTERASEGPPLFNSISISNSISEITNVIEQAPISGKQKKYGNPEINKMLEALKGKIGITAFVDSGIERNMAKHCVNLIGNIGKEEFVRRLDSLLADTFHAKNCNKIKYVYNNIKGFIEPKSKIFNLDSIK